MDASNHNSNTSDGMTGASQRKLTHAQNNTTMKFPSITEIKSKVPGHYFESNTALSLYYAAKDIIIVYLLYATTKYIDAILPGYLLLLWYPVYWLLQGTYMFSLFVVGHDCGHGSFSRHRFLNDVVGTLTHTMVMTPFYPWKLSHHHHHKHTGNIDKDEVFYPIRRKFDNGQRFIFWFGLGIGWFYYLVKGYTPRTMCHLNPFDKMFIGHVTGCTISLLSATGWVVCLFNYACANGGWTLMKLYVVPELVFASWLVIVTFLHHTEEYTPWYADGNWTYVKGQLSSIDRQYGWAHNAIHNIGTHQIHHLFSRIPHYHLEAATACFRRAFPQLIRRTDARILPSFNRMFSKFAEQCVVEDDAEIHMYH